MSSKIRDEVVKMQMKMKAFLLGSAVLFSAMADAQATGNVQLFCNKKNDVIGFKAKCPTAVNLPTELVVLRSLKEVGEEYNKLMNLISEYDAYGIRVPDVLVRFKNKFKIEMALAISRENETEELEDACIKTEKQQRLEFIDSRDEIEKCFGLITSITNTENAYKKLSARLGIKGTECSNDYKIYNLSIRDKNMRTLLQKGKSIDKYMKGMKIRSFFKKIKNGVKAILPRWLTLR